MSQQAPNNREDCTPAAAASTISRSKSMTVIANRTRLQQLDARINAGYTRLHDRLQSMPLAYKLSFFITVLVVSCMTLLGVILIQQQTSQLQDQISEQGHTLAQLMAESAKEPLLADDARALDAITSGFSNNGSVLGTAIANLDGEIISRAGILHEENNLLTRNAIQKIIKGSADSSIWEWQPLMGIERQTVMSFIRPVVFQNVTAGYALVTFSQSGMTQSTRRAVQTIGGATLMIITLSIGMAFAMGRRITQPIDKLVEASRAIGNGEYTFRFKERRKDELGLLMQAFNEMAQGMLEKTQVKSALSRYVSPGVAREILSNLGNVALSGKRIEGSVLFADISGFTRISEETQAEELVSMLNRYFSLITRACEVNFGIVDKYMGDGVMLVFGAPEDDRDHAFHAVCCALLIQKLTAHENSQREAAGLFPVQFRIGINTGSMLAGNMGSSERMEYTVVGDTVNLASRLCGITNSSEIVISREMYAREDISGRVLAGEYQSIRLRGISQPVSTYRVECLTADYQEIVDTQFEKILSSENARDCNA
ncbi:MAG: HAMP domain-containing protein [Gammaproteobacteria bacterium]|jgi:adenylate cyclase|nr:HAMP domain-containing protein [Gammaproteobacteria bacterium]